MKAMILAAGEGTRVPPITYSMPKPMIPLLGKPVMEFLVEHLARHGFFDDPLMLLRGEIAGARRPGREIRPGVFVDLDAAVDLIDDARISLVGRRLDPAFEGMYSERPA
jgi:hypothetical protein